MSDYIMPDPQIQGWMGYEELNWLYHMAQRMDTIVEVGSWKGRSTHALASGCRGKVIAVDHWLGSNGERTSNHQEATQRDVCQDFWQHCGHFRNLSVLRMESGEASKLFQPGSVDMVFIDAGHEFDEILRDLQLWKPICKNFLCGHDISYDSVKTALEREHLNFKREIDAIWSVKIETNL